MTGSVAANASAEIDFFSLHSRKKKRIDVDMLDYSYVDKCSDVDELKGILAMLRSGKEGRYPHLEKVTEDKILSLLPPRERERIQRMRTEPSQQELSAETQELLSWSEQMDAKHAALQATHKQAPRTLPPVRGAPTTTPSASSSSTATATATQPDIQPAVRKPKQAIPAYDFRAWEKYDVDQALSALDAEDEERKAQARAQQQEREQRERARRQELASLPSYIDYDALSPHEREVYALYEKHKGNESFKANENDDAIVFYTRSLAFDDTNAVVYANRAMAYLRIKSFAAAEQDCSRAISLDPSYVKAWSRRGMTRFRRGKYADAVRDFEHALTLEPESRELAKLLAKTQAKWREVDGTVDCAGSNATTSISSNQDTHDAAMHAASSHSAKPLMPSSAIEPAHPEAEAPVTKAFTRFAIIEESDAESDEDDDEPRAQDDDDREVSYPRFEILED